MKGGRGTINVGYPYRVYPNQWLHSDIKDVSYFFNFKFYQSIKKARGSGPSVYVLLYMLDCVAAASFHIRPTYADDEDVVVMQ